jgi:hypothetical protein
VRVRFPAYRNYIEASVAANDAMMALIIGARLGEHALKTSAAAADARLPDLFGRIRDIHWVNRTVGDAAQLLPYVLGVHAAFVSTAIEMLREDGRDDEFAPRTIAWRADVNDIPLNVVHEYFAERSGATLPADLLRLFHLARRIRNRIVHFAGDAGSRIEGEYRRLPLSTRETWERVAGRPLTVQPDGRLALSSKELVAVLAFTRGLGRSINDCLAATLGRAYWVRILIDDYRAVSPQRFGDKSQRVRRVMGHARTFYRPLGIQEAEIRHALGEKV